MDKEKQKEYYEANKERIKERTKEYYEANKERIKERTKKYHEANKERIKERTKEYCKKYRQENKESIKEYTKTYRQANREIINEKKKEYYEANREIINEKGKEYFKTENGKKSGTICRWKNYGLTDTDVDYIYDLYKNTTNCWVCNHDFSKYWKCMDHNHETGEFRQILCNKCNCHDSWKKYSEIV